ncbi:MAG: VCBS repeat-containing protein [Verrucomicrobia bacterium]|nr:VCBS repeat-containing protein [Verrucomicrobiota bacterium]
MNRTAPVKYLLYCSFLFSVISIQGAGQFPSFTVHTIDHWGQNIGQTALADVDRDGDLDWIAGNASHARQNTAEICWWEFQGPDKWVRHPIGVGNTDVGGAAFDVNGDGWVDFVAGSKLLLNSREPKAVPFQVFDIGAIHSHDTEFADVNGDGKMDLIANSDKTGLYWYEIPPDPRAVWYAHMIDTIQSHKVHGGVAPKAVGDIDGDGDIDICTKPWSGGNEHLFLRNMQIESRRPSTP